MNITPEQARSFAEEATLKVETLTHIEKDQVFYSLVTDDDRLVATDLDKGDAELLAIAPDLAQTIATMRWEYAVQTMVEGGWEDIWDLWFTEKEARKEYSDLTHDDEDGIYRLVRRLVGPVEVAE